LIDRVVFATPPFWFVTSILAGYAGITVHFLYDSIKISQTHVLHAVKWVLALLLFGRRRLTLRKVDGRSVKTWY